MEWNINDFLEVTMSEMMQKETKKKIFVNVPLTFDRPDGFRFSKQDDLMSDQRIQVSRRRCTCDYRPSDALKFMSTILCSE